jgi:nicotinamidase/pyrazinamidase
MGPPRLNPHDAVIIVDVQRDFCPGGSLAVADGDQVVPVLNDWMRAAVEDGAIVVVSRDWHPAGHMSFQESGGPWPAHCVQNTGGAEFHPGLSLPREFLLISKGTSHHQDEYSDFERTNLTEDLKERGIKRVWVGGLALDVCVRATVLDAVRDGFEVHLIRNGTRPIDVAAVPEVIREMSAAGVCIENEIPESGHAAR